MSDTATLLEEDIPRRDREAPPPPTVAPIHVPEGAVLRLQTAGEVVVAADGDVAALVLVSTRLPRDTTVAATMAQVAERFPEVPVVVLVHPGGEPLAVEFLRHGARGVVAEGNEAQIQQWLDRTTDHEPLVDTFAQHLVHSKGAVGAETGLQGWASFQRRLHDMSRGGTLPRVALARIPDWEEATHRLSTEAAKLLTRRLEVQVEDLCRRSGADLYNVAPGEFALIARDHSPTQTEELGRNLVAVVATFSPNHTTPLRAAFGHVGPELTSDAATLLELARRAVGLAAASEGAAVVNADELSGALASSTELDTAFQAVATLERHDPLGGSHGSRVSEAVGSLGQALRLEGRELLRLRLAARLHDLGKVSLPPEAMHPYDGDEAAFEVYRRHPELGAEALRAAGREVMSVVRHHHERWDGGGFPDGLEGTAIPFGARIVAIADAFDRWSEAGRVPEAALRRIEEEAGNRFDPDLAHLAVQALTPREVDEPR